VLLDERAHDLRLGCGVVTGGALVQPLEAHVVGGVLTAGVHRFEVRNTLEFRDEGNRNVFGTAVIGRVIGVALCTAGCCQCDGGGCCRGHGESSCMSHSVAPLLVRCPSGARDVAGAQPAWVTAEMRPTRVTGTSRRFQSAANCAEGAASVMTLRT